MAKVERVEKVLFALQKRIDKARRDAAKKVVVGYSASYAPFVHENLQAHHPRGQAKFLEQPARTLGPVLAGLVAATVARGGTYEQGLRAAGERLLAESRKLVPVDTGFLRDSGFVKVG